MRPSRQTLLAKIANMNPRATGSLFQTFRLLKAKRGTIHNNSGYSSCSLSEVFQSLRIGTEKLVTQK